MAEQLTVIARIRNDFPEKFGVPRQSGLVEGLVGWTRRNILVPVPRVDDIGSLNEMLLERCLKYERHQVKGKRTLPRDKAGRQTAQIIGPAAGHEQEQHRGFYPEARARDGSGHGAGGLRL